MARSTWSRSRRTDATRQSCVGALACAAVAGEETSRLIERAARALLEAGAAHRVGVWLAPPRASMPVEGTVLERSARMTPSDWRQLDLLTPPLGTLLERRDPWILDPVDTASAAACSLLAGTRQAVWLPLRFAEQPLGWALAAYVSPPASLELEPLEVIAAELTLALAARRAAAIAAEPAPLPPDAGSFHSKLAQTEKMAALGKMVSGIAHELNNPLTSIMGYAQLLLSRHRDASPATRDAEDADRIYQEAERASRLVRNLLLFARDAKSQRRAVDLNEIVERTLALRSYELRVENIAVELALASGLPRALADPHEIQQVILNLLLNAEQAIEGAGPAGHISIRTRAVSDQRVAVEVSDDGPGVPPELASRVFDPFFTTKPLGAGTGLGLSIAFGIVQEHGGNIYLENRSGCGATFVVELPVSAASEAPAPGEPAAGPMGQARPGGRILVVEDEPTVAQLVFDVLTEQGHEVEAVLDSAEGLERARGGRYDLVICDLRMPRLDGRAFYQALLEAESPLRHRVVFITGDTLAPRTLAFLETHRILYLAKPFLVQELISLVNRALDSAQSGATDDNLRPSPDSARPA